MKSLVSSAILLGLMVAGTSLVPLRTLAQGETAAKPAIEGSEKSGGRAADQSASEAIDNAKEATNEAIEAAKQAILNAIDQAKQKASSTLAAEKEATARAMEKAGEATRVLDQAADAARDVLDKAKQATEEVLEKAKEAVKQGSETASPGSGPAPAPPAEGWGSMGPLDHTSWRLVRFVGGDGAIIKPDDGSKYTLTFGADGNLSARIDCNRGRGIWESKEPNQLVFGPMALTRAMCPPASMHDKIAKDLGFVRSYVLKDGHLFLSLMADAGIYEFEPVARQ